MMYTGESPEDVSEYSTTLVEKGDKLHREGYTLFNERKYLEAKSTLESSKRAYNEAIIEETDSEKIAGINEKISRVQGKILEIEKLLSFEISKESNFNYSEENSRENPEKPFDLLEKGEKLQQEGLALFSEKRYEEAKSRLDESICAFNEAILGETDPDKQAKIHEIISQVREKFSEIDVTLSIKSKIEACKIYISQGHYTKSRDVLNPILEKYPNNPSALGCKARSYYHEGDYEQSFEYIKQAVDSEPRNSVLWFYKGKILLKRIKSQEALESFQQAVTLNDEYYMAWKFLAVINYDKGDYNRAIAAFEKAKVSPNDLETYKKWIYALLKNDRPDDARRKIREALDLSSPEMIDEELNYLWAESCVYKGEYQDAIRALTNVLEKNPSHLDARYFRAYSILFANQNYDDKQIYADAMNEVNELLKLDPKHQNGLYLKGILLTLQNSNQEAISIYDTIANQNPKYLNVFLSKASTLVKEKKYFEAIEVANQLLTLDPKNEGAQYILGGSYRETGDWSKACEKLDKLILQNPNNYNALSLKGKTLFDMEEYDSAINEFLKIIKLNTVDSSIVPPDIISDSKYHVAMAYYRSKKWSDAINFFDDYLMNSDKNGVDAYSILSVCYNKTSQYEKALETADKAIALDKTAKLAYQQRANALTHLDRLEDALSTYDCLTKLEPEDPDEWNSYGVLLYRVGRKTDALQAFKQALDIDDSEDVYRYNIAIVNTDSDNIPEALKDIEQVIAHYPKNAKYWYLKAIILSNKQTYPEAMISVTKALKYQPENQDAQELKAQLFPRMDDEINQKNDKIRERLNKKVQSNSKIPNPIENEYEEE